MRNDENRCGARGKGGHLGTRKGTVASEEAGTSGDPFYESRPRHPPVILVLASTSSE